MAGKYSLVYKRRVTSVSAKLVYGFSMACLATMLVACGGSTPDRDPSPTPALSIAPSPTSTPAPLAACEADPAGCVCAVESCLPIPTQLLAGQASCPSSLLPSSCADVMTDSFARQGCGETCKGLTVPGLEALCEMPECDGFLDLSSIVGVSDLCQCYCEPQCAGRTCGDDGCGGVCGGCAGDESCVFGECAPVAGECRDSDFTCYCAMVECESEVSTGERLRICSELRFGYPDCEEAFMRSYADKGCPDPGAEPFLGRDTLCDAPVCADFVADWQDRTGVDLCAGLTAQ